MNTSDAGLGLIKKFEGVRAAAYPDPGTGGEPITIGVGHTGGVKLGDTATMDQINQWLKEDVRDAEAAVNRLVRVDLEQYQFDALVSLIFNIGAGNFERSTLLSKLNAGDVDGAADEFLRWNRAGGQRMSGLTKRRIAERMLFLTGEA